LSFALSSCFSFSPLATLRLTFGASLPLVLTFLHMDSQDKGIKRARTQQQDGAGASDNLPGREQLLLTSPELQTRLGRKYCDEAEMLPLLIAHGFVRRVRTIQDIGRGEAAGRG
jgi:hypothetical protein